VGGEAADGVTSFLTTFRFVVVFLAFLEDFTFFFFAISLLDDAAAYIPSKRRAERKGESEAAHGRCIERSCAVVMARDMRQSRHVDSKDTRRPNATMRRHFGRPKYPPKKRFRRR
jgi:hypothetical protein